MSTDIPAADVPTPEAAVDEPLLVFVHIRKTAGKTLRQILYRQYGRGRTRLVRNYFVAPEISLNVVKDLATSPPPELRAVHGHFLFWPDITWPENTQFLTLLRDPVERVISHYFWLKSRSSRFKKTLEEAVSDGSIHDNLQTRVLAAEMPPFGETNEEMLEAALRSLKRLDVVGLTERFDESLVLATRVLGWRRMLYRRENVTPDRKPKEEISSNVVDLIKQHNALDIELYRSASKRFDREIEAQGEGFAIEVEALKRANAWAASVPEDAVVEPLPPAIDNAHPDGTLDLRELLIDAHAQLLQRDAVIERMNEVSTPRPATRVATRARKRDNPPDRRRAALEAAISRARTRLDNVRKEIRALEKEGAAASQPAKLEALRLTEEATAKRLEGFERRSGKLGKRGRPGGGTGAEAGEPAPARRKKAAAAGGEPRPRKKKAAGAAARQKKERPPAPTEALEPTAEAEPAPDAKPERQRTTKIEGTRRFESAPAEVVWEVLDHPARVASLIPAVESFEVQDERHWTAKVKIPLRPNSPLVLKCEKSDQRRPEHGRLIVRGRGAGASVKIDGTYDLSESNGGTDMKWQTSVELTGPVGPMGPRVLQVLVRKQMKTLLAALEREVVHAKRPAAAAADGDGATADAAEDGS